MSGAAGDRDVRTVERRNMIRLEKRGIIKRFDLLDTLSFFAFCMSVPLFLPVLEQWRGMTSSVAVSWSFLPSVSFSAALSLAAMFTALAFLFICLLKTAHARVSRTIMLLALACYAIGYGLLDLWSFGALDGSVVEAGSGLMMGFGAAVMCLVWMSRLHVLEFRRALVVAWVAGCVLFASASLLPMLGATPARTVLTVAAALSVVGCARLFFRSEGEDERSAQAGVNWWDVFGHLDVSVVEGTGDFKTPLARALFFAVMPFAMLLLFVADNSLVRTMDWGVAPLALAGVLAVAVMVPLIRMKTDQALINFSYRFFLPLVAFAVFAATAFVEPPLQRSVMAVGSLSFCAIYARHHDHRRVPGVPAVGRQHEHGRASCMPVPGADRAVRGDGDRAHGHSQLAIVARYARGHRCRRVERARSSGGLQPSLRRSVRRVPPDCARGRNTASAGSRPHVKLRRR